MHDPKIAASPACTQDSISEYWHENDSCGLTDCAVNECLTCGMFATECGQTDA